MYPRLPNRRITNKLQRELPIKSSSVAFGMFTFNLDFIRNAPGNIFTAYRELGATSFAIPALSEYQVFACSQADVKAVCEARETSISFDKAMDDRLKYKHTMFGFEPNHIDPHHAVPGRTIKVLLRTNLPNLRPNIKSRVTEGFAAKLDQASSTVDGWTRVSAFGLARSITESVNSEVLLGSKLADCKEFMAAATRYSNDAAAAFEICRQLPSVFTPLVAPAIMAWSGSMKKVAAAVREVVVERLEEMTSLPYHKVKHMDCLQWVIESSNTPAQRTVERLTQQIGALFFASSHQMPMALVYAIYSLCDHPEYIEQLQQEIADNMSSDVEDSFKNMHLLDAFLRESARLNPLDALSIQRKVLSPFTLPSGGHIPAGNLVAIPQQAVLQNPEYYPNPSHFDPYRYFPNQTRKRHQDVTTRYTDVSHSFPYWGSPRKPCPGRWYVSEMLKLALVHLITEYDFKLEDSRPRSFNWTTAVVPRMRTQILLRKKSAGL